MKQEILAGVLLVSSVVNCGGNACGDTYDVYLLAGQSNMDGRGKAGNLTPAQRSPIDSAIIYYRNPPRSSDGWKPLAPGFSIPPKYKGSVPSPTFGPEIGFAEAMIGANPNRMLALIKGSEGGTSLRKDWKPGEKGKPETQGECYRDFIQTIRMSTDALTKAGHRYTQFTGYFGTRESRTRSRARTATGIGLPNLSTVSEMMLA